MSGQYTKKTPLTLGAQTIAAALAFGTHAAAVYAEEPECEDKKDVECVADKEAIEHIEIHGVRHSVYRYDRSGDPRRVADLVDTPQTISVLTLDQIQESGRTDLKDILNAQAGVTLGTGENGNAFGDRYIIRGHEARSDVFVDGLRDPGMTTRESFATERVEITKGPSSTFAGRGSSGGAVNSITKKASTAYNFGRVDLAAGSDDHSRFTVDYNLSLSDEVAVRINGLSASEDKPGREGIERERDGAQLSGIYNPSEKLSFIADVYYLDAHDKPDLGSYFDKTVREPVEDIPVYAQDNDFLDSEVTTFTLRTEYKINDKLRFYNATRTGQTENGYITTGLHGTNRADTDPEAPGAATMTLSTHQGWQEVDYVTTQFNLFWDAEWFGREHKLVFGLEYTDESVDNGVYDIEYGNETNCLTSGRRGVSGAYCILDAEGNLASDLGRVMGRTFTRGEADSLYDIETVSAYVMDTFAVTDKMDIFFGLRQDRFDYSNVTSDQLYAYSDTMYNGHLGLVYDLAENGNVYATYSTATNINGGESDLGTNCGYGGLCGTPEQAAQADPEVVENLELGTKWMLFDEKLMFTAAAFRMTKSDVMESVGDSYSTLGTLNTGENRVEGVEFGLSGDITDKLSIQASATLMDSEVLDSYNEENIGLALSNFSEKSYYFQIRYQPTERLAFGGDYTYQGEMYGGQPDTAAGYDHESGQYSIVVPSYQVVGLFANYHATERLTVRANIGNLLDEEYWTAAYRSGAFMYLGDGRSFRTTLTYEF
ncbi:TonB-dependent receptor [Microbulbifer thermotolerans]|uniref:TonB-dependent receptor n=1 Tax=Microbulbifer thermotolerans TaxID=252514 RepID=A0A143HJ70_MICTH|nr:TonB-dependent receptor [Microbulbifer thermotolerans]AMX01551.1 TonB-dependent receptor [Microbulbifer thermotolerans]MCX2778404.1 TonB-dependent receptor [Microbulbifer thermotolerans]MCX2796173.1 TonB-dependent receptor [Microbulbifer thermotolerans]MCX2804443.1 TonB-dependent receptor [Microbulbifer thermotolerans]MCX2832591.1 TonB-dependent receptor [Microbulbifer thermotolerans]